MLAIETRQLCKVYGHQRVIDDLNMHVPQGSIYGFVGKNGAGKSTVMKMIDHLVRPTSGSISLFGSDSESEEANRIQRVGSLIESPGLLPDLSAYDNLMGKALALGLTDPGDSCQSMLRTVGLEDAKRKRVKKFSLGMKQRLGIALALLGSPDLLLLDEPFNGLDPEVTRELRNLIADINRLRGVTVVISSHVLDQLDRIVTDYGVIAHGHMVAEMSAEQVEQDCGDSLRVKADKPEQALVFLERQFPSLRFLMEPGGCLRVRGMVPKDQGDVRVDADQVAYALRDQGITVLELSVVKRDIEDYFVELMEGGAENVQSA